LSTATAAKRTKVLDDVKEANAKVTELFKRKNPELKEGNGNGHYLEAKNGK
jgi:hypothetical protein